MLGLGNYSDSEQLENHIVQVLTGQGKSITIAVTAAVLALLGFDVYCACYSSHLSQRDHEAFQELFDRLDVGGNIQYGTLEALCESVINA